MAVAVTGSTGTIGKALCAALRANGQDVVRVVRPSTSDRSGTILEWDLQAGTIDRSGLEGLDAVVHLAGEGIADHRWSAEQKQRILESRVRGTSLLATEIAACDQPPATFISGSAIGLYGDRGDETLDESSAPGTGFLADVVTAWEGATAAAESATRVAHIRTGIVMDADEGALAEQLPFFKLGLGGRVGDGSQWWSWIGMTDMIRALQFILATPSISGPVNMTAPGAVRHADFAKTLGSVLHRPAILPTPKLALNLKLGAELAEALLFTSAHVLPRKLLDAGFVFEHPELADALRATLEA